MYLYMLHPLIRGNHYVKIQIDIPTNLTEKQTQLLEEFNIEESVKEKVNPSSSKGSGGVLDSAWSRLKSFLGNDHVYL